MNDAITDAAPGSHSPVSALDEHGRKILESARHLLAEHGAQALTVRRIATDAGYSTMVLYARFSGKDAIIDELFIEGFEGLREICSSEADAAGALATLRIGLLGYRRWALAHPTHYAVMFNAAVPDYAPSQRAGDTAHGVLMQLQGRVEAAIESGELAQADPHDLAHVVWSVCHGLVSIELLDMHSEGIEAAERRYELALDAVLAGLAASRSSAG